MLVAGVDSSTQSTKVLLCQAEDGAVVGQGSAPHPGGTECDPHAWWTALQRAGAGLIERAAGVAVAGQQHGMVVLDADDAVIRPALLWNDLRSSAASADLIAELGGPRWWAEQTGSVPHASFTVTKLRWLAEHEPANASKVARVMLPHDWLTWRLGAAEPVTDRGDASGTGYFATPAGGWMRGVAAAALGHEPILPRVAGPGEAVGETIDGALLAPGTGDNMAAALGLGLEQGEVAVSVGTSGTVFAVTTVPAADPSGAVAGFADATGRFLPLVCTANAGLVLSAVATMTGTDLAGLAQRALAAQPGAAGITLLPYFDGERTPERRARISRRRCRPSCRLRRAVPPGTHDRGRRPLGSCSRPGSRHLRAGRGCAGTAGIRRARRGTPGGVGPGRDVRASCLAAPVRHPLPRDAAARGAGALRRPAGCDLSRDGGIPDSSRKEGRAVT